jgi:hypothetical protein
MLALWNTFKSIAIWFSFIMNFIMLLVLIFVVALIFQIKNGIAEPLIVGLHSSFVGLDQARILTTIDVNDTINVKDTIIVNDTIPVRLNIPLKQDTNVVLTRDVPLRLPTTFTLRDGTALSGTVSLALPAGLQLPVALDLNVPVDEPLPITLNVPVDLKVPINLKVPVDIPLNQTQLHDPFDKLRGLFDPFVRALGNLPGSWGEVPDFARRAASGQVNLLANNPYTERPWGNFTTGNGTGTPSPMLPDQSATSVPSDNPSTAVPTDAANGTTNGAATGGTDGGNPAADGSATRVNDLGIITQTPTSAPVGLTEPATAAP